MRAILAAGRAGRASGVLGRAAPSRDVVLAALVTGLLCAGLAAAADVGLRQGLLAIVAGLLLPGGAIVAVLRRRPASCSPADEVTLARAGIAGGCATLLVAGLLAGMPVRTWEMFALGVTALVLDAVDGLVARSTHTSSAVGARFDMEVDSAVFLLLTVIVSAAVVPWAWAIGAMRYLFVAGSWMRPAWRAPLPPRSSRRVIAALQGVAIGVALAPVVDARAAAVVLGTAGAALLFSFVRDVVSLEVGARARRR